MAEDHGPQTTDRTHCATGTAGTTGGGFEPVLGYPRTDVGAYANTALSALSPPPSFPRTRASRVASTASGLASKQWPGASLEPSRSNRCSPTGTLDSRVRGNDVGVGRRPQRPITSVLDQPSCAVRRLRSAVLLAALAVAAASGARAQSASATVSATVVEVGESVTYTVTLEGGRGQSVGPPLATGALRLRSPFPVLDATTSVNGAVERRLAWAYEATRPGSGRIGRFRAAVGGQPVDIDGISVTVQRPAPTTAAPPSAGTSPPRPGASRELFARAEPSRQTAYVGQQVVVDYVLYFEPEIQPRQTAPVGTWDAPGAWREEMEVASTYPRPVTIGGAPYDAVTIRRVALFPTRAGTLSLAPMTFTVDLLRVDRQPARDPFSPFFSPFRSRYEDREVVAPSVEIDVRPLPPGAPPSFAGAVGQFELSTTVDQREVAAGDPVRIQVAVRGDGNTAALRAPQITAPAGFDAYDPREDREVFRGGEPLRGVKTFTYTLVPQGGGRFTIPGAPWTYFDPTTGRYVTVQTDPVEITVQGDALADAETAAPGPNAPAGLMASADWRRPPGRAVWLWALLGGGLALPLAAAGLVLGARAGRQRLAADTPAKRHRRAPAAVRERLADARRQPRARAFAEIESAVRGYLTDRLGVPPGPLSSDALDAALPSTSADARARLAAVLDACAVGQFAPGLGPDVEAVARDAEAAVAALDAGPSRPTLRLRRRPEPVEA